MSLWLERVNHFLWNGILLWVMLGLGAWLTLRSGFYPIRKIQEIWRFTFGSLFSEKKLLKKQGISPFAAVSTALAGTIGTGNIAGVAVALIAGGPGAVFWMWVSAFFGMMTKQREIFLAVRFREKGEDGQYYGGPMQYMEKGLGSKALAGIFSFFCIIASFGIGNMTQIHEAAGMVYQAFDIPPVWTGAVVACLCAVVLLGGAKRIASLNEKLVPAMGLFYMGGAVLCLLCRTDRIFPAFQMIFSHAFSSSAAVGGVGGYGVSQAVRIGLARGMFTNEAGLGSAPIAHGAAQTDRPEKQAAWGIVEVFLDTLLMCTVTALVILTAQPGLLESGLSGAALTAQAFGETLGDSVEGFLSVSMISFALASILGWCFYGQRAVSYLFPGKSGSLLCYRVCFLMAILFGAAWGTEWVWNLSDLFNGLMALPNLAAVALLSVWRTKKGEGKERFPVVEKKKNRIPDFDVSEIPGRSGGWNSEKEKIRM